VLPECIESRKEWEAALDAIRWLRGQLGAANRVAQRLLVVGDGGFCVADLFRELPHGVDMMARCARNRALYELPHNEGCKRGRRRKYGDKARKPHQWLAERSGWHPAEFMVRGRPVRPRYRIEGPFVLKKAAERPVFLVVVKGIAPRTGSRPRTRRHPAIFLISAVQKRGRWVMPFAAEYLLELGWDRWEVEIVHRERKSSLGLGETQCWSKAGAILAVRWQAWSYGDLVLAGYGPGDSTEDRSVRQDGGGMDLADGL
jgi:hypothetical protein